MTKIYKDFFSYLLKLNIFIYFMPEGPEISYMTYIFNNKFKNSILKKLLIITLNFYTFAKI
jgi:hypothetical protein